MKIFEKLKGGRQKAKCDKDTLAEVRKEFEKCEVCGKCIPGREGTKQMMRILNKVCSQGPKAEDLALLEELATVVEKTCRCKKCKTVVTPVLKAVSDFQSA